jgi:hypothetical protein
MIPSSISNVFVFEVFGGRDDCFILMEKQTFTFGLELVQNLSQMMV